jgi:hypothetical protein
MMVRSSQNDTNHAPATIEIISIPLGATVKVDGVALAGVTPLRFETAAPGKAYALTVELEHYEPWSRSETVPTTTRQMKVIASMRPILGTLAVTSTPSGAEVFINNHAVGRTPLTLDDVDPFVPSRVEVRLRGHKPQVQEVAWNAQEAATLDFALAPAP